MAENETIDLALWGPSAAGKSMLVAQLYLAQNEARTDWDVLPTAEVLELVQQMRASIDDRNAFLLATGVGNEQELTYHFRHKKTGRQATLFVEDRAGVEWENMDPDALAKLQSAKGVVLLFDPTRPEAIVESEVQNTLEKLYVIRGANGKDPRPVAVCLSKADTCIQSSEDFARATSPATMHEFAAQFLTSRVFDSFGRFLTNYRLFPVSSAGVRAQWGIVEPFAFLDEGLDARLRKGGEPINLFAPFHWLFEVLGGP